MSRQKINFYKIIFISLFCILSLFSLLQKANANEFQLFEKNKIIINDKIISKPITIDDNYVICCFKNQIEILDNNLNQIVNIPTKIDRVFDYFKINDYILIPFLNDNTLYLFIINYNNFNYTIKTIDKFDNIKSVIFNEKNEFIKELIAYFDKQIYRYYINLKNIYNNEIDFNLRKNWEGEIGNLKGIKKIYNYYYGYDYYDKLIIFDENFNTIGKYKLGKAGSKLYPIKDNKFVLASDKGFYIIDSNNFSIISKQDFSSLPITLIKVNDYQFITITNDYKLISFNIDNNYNISSSKLDLFIFEPYEFVNIFYHDGILLNLYDYYNPYTFISTGYTDITIKKDNIQYIDYDTKDDNLFLSLSGSIYLNINRTQFIKDKNTKKYKNVYNYNSYQFKINPIYLINTNLLSIRYYRLLQSIPLSYYSSINIPKDKYYNSFYDTFYFKSLYNIFSYVISTDYNLYYFINYPKHTVIYKF